MHHESTPLLNETEDQTESSRRRGAVHGAEATAGSQEELNRALCLSSFPLCPLL